MTQDAAPGHLATLARMLAQDDNDPPLSLRHLQVLGWICWQDGPSHVGWVAKQVGVHQSGVSRAITALAKHRLVARASETGVGYVPTDEGRRIDLVMQAIYAPPPPTTTKGRRRKAP